MTDDTIAEMRAIIAALEAENFILKHQLAEGIRARRVTTEEFMRYTEGLEYIRGKMKTKNGVEVFVAAEEVFQEIKDAVEDYQNGVSIEEQFAKAGARAKLKPEKVIVGRDAQLAGRDAEIADLKRQLTTGIRARRVTMDEFADYLAGKLEFLNGRMVAGSLEVFVAESEDFQRQKEAIAEWEERRREGEN